MWRLNGNDIARTAYENDRGCGYAAGDHQWPISAPWGSQVLALTVAKFEQLGIVLDTREADLERARAYLAEHDASVPAARRERPSTQAYRKELVSQIEAMEAALAAQPTVDQLPELAELLQRAAG